MAGAFEIIDFDEKKTILDIWQFLTEKLKINPKKLWITAFDKDKVADKTISLSKELKDYLAVLVEDRLVFGNQETNLWSQGGGAELTDNIKLCGPQIEFFYDFGKNKDCDKKSCNPFCDCNRFLEISNTLFIKYYIDFKQEPKLKELINPSTEAVIGIERVVQIVEQKYDRFIINDKAIGRAKKILSY